MHQLIKNSKISIKSSLLKSFGGLKSTLLVFTAIGIIYVCNLFIDIMEIDAAQYAAISREMMQSGSFLQVFEHGKDYLDKPPMLFWMAAVSMKILGVSNLAYKLPALMIILLGIWSTYQFARMYYTRQTAVLAALVLSTTQAYFLITNDVRTDGILTSLIIFTVWQFHKYLMQSSWKFLLFASFGLAAAMMTKGPIAFILVGLAVGGDILMKRNWSALFRWQWLLAFVVIVILLLPMCYGLYQQFDLHPEKNVYGLQGPSGIKFFFWTQSFGRITGDIYWNNNSPVYYFLETILWDFMPWVLFLVPAVFWKIKNLLKDRFKIEVHSEASSVVAFLGGLVILSLSRFKLPHYIFPLFPFAAIFTADFINKKIILNPGHYKYLIRIQLAALVILWFVSIGFFIFCFPIKNYLLPILGIILIGSAIGAYQAVPNKAEAILTSTVLTAIYTGFFLSLYFYPNLLQYQAASHAGKYLKEQQIDPKAVYKFIDKSHSIDFYANGLIGEITHTDLYSLQPDTYIYTSQEGMDTINQSYKNVFKQIKVFTDFNVTRLTMKFLLQDSRTSQLNNTYLLKKT